MEAKGLKNIEAEQIEKNIQSAYDELDSKLSIGMSSIRENSMSYTDYRFEEGRKKLDETLAARNNHIRHDIQFMSYEYLRSNPHITVYGPCMFLLYKEERSISKMRAIAVPFGVRTAYTEVYKQLPWYVRLKNFLTGYGRCST